MSIAGAWERKGKSYSCSLSWGGCTSGQWLPSPLRSSSPSPAHAHTQARLRDKCTMLDTFEVLTTSGVVLWSRKYAAVGPHVINSLIRDVFIEERVQPQAEDAGSKPTYRKEGYTLKWTTSKDLGLIFVAVYQSLVHMTWIDKLLDNIRALFVGLYGDQLKDKHSSVVNCDKFASYFDRQIQELEGQSDGGSSAAGAKLTPPSSVDNESADEDAPRPTPLLNHQRPLYDTSQDSTPVPTPDPSRPNTPAQTHLLTAKTGPAAKLSRRGKKKAAALSSAPASSGDEASVKRKGKGSAKKNRVWGDFGAEEEDPSMVLDYSQSDLRDDAQESEALEEVNPESWGSRTGKGQFVLKDLDLEMDQIIAEQNAKTQTSTSAASGGGLVGSSLGAIGGLFRNVVGGKTLTEEDLAKPLKGMEDHLLKKNVAREAAVRLCESVKRDLVGLKTSSFTSKSTLSFSLQPALTSTLSSRRIHHPRLHGKGPHQDSHTYLLPRSPSRNPDRQRLGSPLCAFHCRRQRRR